MNTCERISCRFCGSLDMRWVTAVLAVFDGTVFRCADCRTLRLVPRV